MKILTLSTYPHENPTHGGQHRLFNIVSNYVECGHSVQSIGVLGSTEYGNVKGYLPYPKIELLKKYIENILLMDDWAIGQLFEKDDNSFNLLSEEIDLIPDVIHVEQPWLFGFARRYANVHVEKNIKIIYGSQNIENTMKFDIVKKYIGIEKAIKAREKVLSCELFAIRNADGICCVSQSDLDWTASRTDRKCVLAQNGVRARKTSFESIERASKLVGNRKFAVYCASAHPPNISGFFSIFENGIGCIAPNESIVIVGGAGAHIAGDSRFSRTAGLNRACVIAGTVSDEDLQSLIEISHTIILPITHGGGTNLKTAEAIWSGKHIVATRTAFRGFDQFLEATGIRISDSPVDFVRNLRDSMLASPNAVPKNEFETRREVLWSKTLFGLNNLVSTS